MMSLCVLFHFAQHHNSSQLRENETIIPKCGTIKRAAFGLERSP